MASSEQWSQNTNLKGDSFIRIQNSYQTNWCVGVPFKEQSKQLRLKVQRLPLYNLHISIYVYTHLVGFLYKFRLLSRFSQGTNLLDFRDSYIITHGSNPQKKDAHSPLERLFFEKSCSE